MVKTCPFKSTPHYSNIDCSDKCVMYEDGCLIKQAVKLYVKNNTPFEMKKPTEEELNRLTEKLKETLARHPEPILFKHPDLNIQHDYDEYGVDWYPHGYDDIAP